MNDKTNKWLCKTFKNTRGDVTIGSILITLITTSISIILIVWLSMCTCTLFGFGATVAYNYYIYGIQVENTKPDFYMDVFIGFILIISSIIVLFCVNKIYSYEITSCKRGN
mgnify:CR=1 FL=1